jgi:hypothetical protein
MAITSAGSSIWLSKTSGLQLMQANLTVRRAEPYVSGRLW